MNNLLDESQIYRWFDIFKDNNKLTEIRLIGTNKVYSGYFTDANTLIKAITPYVSTCNTYFTINSINGECYGREQKDCIIQKPKNTTSDSEVVGRDFVFIDFDSVRITGINASDEEIEYTKKKANEVYKFLEDNGFYKPIVIFSGSGVHFYLKCAMKITPENDDIVKRFTMSLGMLFSDEHVEIDQKVFNAGRISRLVGTYSRKGSYSDKERPQRMCQFVKVPDEIKINDIAYFKKIADLYPKEEKPSKENNYSTDKFDLESFISKHGINVSKIESVAGGKKYILDHCAFNSQHTGKDAVIFQKDSGALSYVCLHNSCNCYKWSDFRRLYEPNYQDNNSYSPRQFKPYDKEERKVIVAQMSDNAKGSVWQTLTEIEDEDRSKIVSIPSGIYQYDKECCGFDKPSLSVWSGNNGSAKSTLLNQIALNAINKGFKVAIYSGELRNKKLKRWIIYQAAGKTYNKKSSYNDYDYYTPNNIKDKIVDWASDRLYNYNTKYSHSIEQICLEVEKIVKEKDIDMLIMDNLSSLDINSLDGGINEQQKEAIKMLLRLTDKLEIATHLVVHPKKSDGYLRKNDVSGAKTLTDLADCVFFVHRWNQDTKIAAKEFMSPNLFNELNESRATNLVEVIKHREFGDAEGHIYKLYFETESKRLKNSIEEHINYGWIEQPVQQELTPITDIQSIYDNAITSTVEDNIFQENTSPLPF